MKRRDGKSVELRTDAILVAAGRKPSVAGVGLEAAGIDYDERTGVKALRLPRPVADPAASP